MRLLKSLGVGLVAAVIATIATVAVWVLAGSVSMWTQVVDGGGGIGGYAINLEIPALVGLVTGIAGFVWQWRRRRRTMST